MGSMKDLTTMETQGRVWLTPACVNSLVLGNTLTTFDSWPVEEQLQLPR